MANDVDSSSELSKIAKLNGDFRRNYGTLIGAVLYLRAGFGLAWFRSLFRRC